MSLRSLFLMLIVLVSISSLASAQPDLSHELAVGSWFGRAVPNDPEHSPFPEVVMTPTFFADGTVIANDSHEKNNPHTTAHGHWARIGENQIEAVFVWLDLAVPPADAIPNGYKGAFKVTLLGSIDPAHPDDMTGTLHALLFPPDTDPLDPANTGSIDLGVFTIVQLRRIKGAPDQPTVFGRNLSEEVATGSWFGRALANNPDSPLQEVIMTPSFFADGNLIANDAQEGNSPHTTAHGDWITTGPNQVKAVFVWMNLAEPGVIPNGYAGAFKVTLLGSIDPAHPDEMAGTLNPVLFPPDTDPLDPANTGGIDLGLFTIVQLRRIEAEPSGPTVPGANPSGALATGSWFGRALANNPDSPLQEVIMTPSFFADGNLIANDAQEGNSPHTTAHGDWITTGPNQVKAVFVWMNLAVPPADAIPNGYKGAFKVTLLGSIDPAHPDDMTGTLNPVLFPPDTDPLDPANTGGIDLGLFTIVQLRRIKVDVGNTLAFAHTLARPGGQALVEVSLHTTDAVAGLQFKIQPHLGPDPSPFAHFTGLINDLENAGFTATSATGPDGVTTVLLFSTNGGLIQPGWTHILDLVYTLDPNTPSGQTIQLAVSHDILSDPNSQAIPHLLEEGSITAGRPGDTAGGAIGGGDGHVDILDLIKEIKYVLGVLSGPEPGSFGFFLADVNNDGDINVLDVVAIIHQILGNNNTKMIAGPTSPVTISLGEVQASASGQLAIPVRLQANGVIAGVQATFKFDPAQLQLGTPRLVGQAAGMTVQSQVSNGTFRVVVYSATGQGITAGSGTALLVPVTVLNGAEPALTLNQVVLANHQAQAIPVSLGTSTVKVSALPSAFALKPNHPNPFNPSTQIAYEVPQSAHITLAVYNLLGQEVVRLVDSAQAAGRYVVTWNGRNAQELGVASGVYLYRLTSSTGFTQTRRMTLLK